MWATRTTGWGRLRLASGAGTRVCSDRETLTASGALAGSASWQGRVWDRLTDWGKHGDREIVWQTLRADWQGGRAGRPGRAPCRPGGAWAFSLFWHRGASLGGCSKAWFHNSRPSHSALGLRNVQLALPTPSTRPEQKYTKNTTPPSPPSLGLLRHAVVPRHPRPGKATSAQNFKKK